MIEGWYVLLPAGLALGYFGTGAVINFVSKRGKQDEVQV